MAEKATFDYRAAYDDLVELMRHEHLKAINTLPHITPYSGCVNQTDVDKASGVVAFSKRFMECLSHHRAEARTREIVHEELAKAQ